MGNKKLSGRRQESFFYFDTVNLLLLDIVTFIFTETAVFYLAGLVNLIKKETLNYVMP